MKSLEKAALCLLLLAGLHTDSRSAPELPAIFGDHMVLQQQREVPIWGWAEPGERISVVFDSTTRTTITDKTGKWQVVFSSLQPGGPKEMRIEGYQSLIIKDVLVGEVWLCSGQSNMAFPLGSTASAERDVAKANYPRMRLFTVPRASTLEPLHRVDAHWEVCTSESAKEFSAVAYFFGRRIHETVNVPIGLIDSSWGGTQAEEWTDQEYLEKDPEFQPILQRWEDTAPQIKSLYVEPLPFELWLDDFQFLPIGGGDPHVLADFEDMTLTTTFGGRWSDEWVEPKSAYTAEVSQPGRNNSVGAAHIRGQIEVSHWPMFRIDFKSTREPVNLSRYKGVSFYSRGKGYFRFHLLQPSITDWDNYSSATSKATQDWSYTEVLFEDLRQSGWGKQLLLTPDRLTGMVLEPQLSNRAISRPPGGLFRGMIAPILPYAIRGAIWYQGEGNAGRAYQYRKLLPTLIQSWRKHWNQGEFPFLVVQLPNFGRSQAQPGESKWAELREAQLMSLKLTQTGLAVSIDVGEADDVHPRRKTEIGERLAAWALAKTYGRELVYSGPLFDSATFRANRCIVTFKHIGSGLVSGGGDPLRGFALAGSDRRFYWAEAKIVGDKVEVYSARVPHPVALRYGWDDNPDCNLFNKEGFPASPFRTDDWPGLTFKER